MAIQERFYSAEDLWVLSHATEYSEQRLELIEGVLVVMSPAGGKHGGLAFELAFAVGGFVKEHDLGYVTAAETGYILFKNPHRGDTVLAPDVGYVRADRLPDGLPDQYIPLAPDLAIEVVSPNDTASEIHDKVTTYLKYGTRLIWVFYPTSKTVAVHTQAGSHTVDADGVLDGGEVLPGFTLKVSQIFGE